MKETRFYMKMAEKYQKKSVEMAKKLRVFREARGWSMADLSRESGLSTVTIWYHENGRVVPSRGAWESYGEAYGVRVRKQLREAGVI